MIWKIVTLGLLIVLCASGVYDLASIKHEDLVSAGIVLGIPFFLAGVTVRSMWDKD